MWLVLAAVVRMAPSNLATGPATANVALLQPRRDSDGDGIPDDEEDLNGNGIVDPGETDPNDADSDHDNVPDDVERRLGTDPTRADDVPPIPEPLLVDLARNLGSTRNEFEANVLASTTFESIDWGPELEYAPLKNVGLELELPCRDASVRGVKGGAQYTIGSLDRRRLEVGVIGSYEHGFAGPERRTSLLAIAGTRISSSVQMLTLVGPTMDFARARPAGATLNPSVFLQTNRVFTSGLELGYRVQQAESSTFTALPQVHVNPIPKVKLQIGVGVSVLVGRSARPLTAVRVSYEP